MAAAVPDITAVVREADGMGVEDVVKGVQALGVEADGTVTHLSPQAEALARMASEARCHRDVDWDIRPHAMLEAAAPTREQFDNDETGPVVIMRNPIAGKQVIAGSTELAQPVPINTDEPITVKTGLFNGTLQVHIRGLKTTHEGVFEGKKRFLHVAMQGTFSRDIKASDFWNGHEWFSVSEVVPQSFVNLAYTAAAKMFSSTTRVCPSTSNGQIAGFLNPVLASCQLVNVSRPGEQPDMWEAHEDMRLLSDALTDKHGDPLPAEKRRRWFDNAANAATVTLSKEYVYTWHVWQHWCNIATYRLQLNSLLSFDLCQFSEGQPMQIMAKDQSTGEYSINLLLWHKRLLFTEDAAGASGEHHTLRERLKNMRSSWKGLLAGGGSK